MEPNMTTAKKARPSSNIVSLRKNDHTSDITCSGNPIGNAKGSFILLDGETFMPKVVKIFYVIFLLNQRDLLARIDRPEGDTVG